MQDVIYAIIEELKINLYENIVSVVEETTSKAMKAIKEKTKAFANGFMSGFKNSNQQNTKLENVDSLDKAKLVAIAQKYIVSGATEVAAYKSETDEAYVVYLAYTKDRELLDPEKNCYVIIKSNALAKDVAKLFGEEKLIILK